jgi:hypothetical protein
LHAVLQSGALKPADDQDSEGDVPQMCGEPNAPVCQMQDQKDFLAVLSDARSALESYYQTCRSIGGHTIPPPVLVKSALDQLRRRCLRGLDKNPAGGVDL